MRTAALLHAFVAHLGLERLVPTAAIEDFLAGHERGENHTTDAETQTDAADAAHACSTHRELAELRASVASLRADVKTLQEKQEPETGGLEHDVAELRASVASVVAAVASLRHECAKSQTQAPSPILDMCTSQGAYYELLRDNKDEYKKKMRRKVVNGIEYIVGTGYHVYAYNTEPAGWMFDDVYIPMGAPGAAYNVQRIYNHAKGVQCDLADVTKSIDELKKTHPSYYTAIKGRGWIPAELL